MAVNLAASLRVSFPGVQITVISDGSWEAAAGGFEASVVPVKKGLNPFEVKTLLPSFSPYQHTLYLDADTILLLDPYNKPRDLEATWNAWGDPPFRMMEYGRHPRDGKGPVWGKLPEIFDHYDLGGLYPEYNSSIILFDNSEDTKHLFQEAHKAYINPCPVNETVGGYFPDEVAFGVASMKTGTYSDIEKWQPIHFPWHKGSIAQIRANSDFISLAGGRQPRNMSNLYDATAREVGKLAGIPTYKFNERAKVAWK